MNSSNHGAPDMGALKQRWHAGAATEPAAGWVEQMTRDIHARTRRQDRARRARRVFGSAAFGLTLAGLVVCLAIPGVWPGMRVALALWSASLMACVVGLWWVRPTAPSVVTSPPPLAEHLQRSLQQMRREIAYHYALRWLYWLPFSIGLLAALAGRVSPQPDMSWLLVAATLVACGWGFINGPRHWPRRLEPEADALEQLLADVAPTAGTARTPRNG